MFHLPVNNVNELLRTLVLYSRSRENVRIVPIWELPDDNAIYL